MKKKEEVKYTEPVCACQTEARRRYHLNPDTHLFGACVCPDKPESDRCHCCFCKLAVDDRTGKYVREPFNPAAFRLTMQRLLRERSVH